MNYNQFSYYRANPYYKIGYMPPIAHLNRKEPGYLVELPQGDEHLHRSGRKHFSDLKFKNSIQEQKILTSPQKYPFQNRIAMDKSYLRSLNTIDIEGASSNTLVSMAVRNKLKAKEQLTRRQVENKQSEYLQKIKNFEVTQDERRRELAMKQFQRINDNNQLIYKRNLRANSIEIPNKTIDNSLRYQTNYQNNHNNHSLHIQDNSKIYNNPEISIEPKQDIKKQQYQHSKNNQFASRYQPVKQTEYSQKNNYQKNNYQETKTKTANQRNDLDYPSIYNSKEDMRKHNPTYLSFASPSIRMAGRNIVGS